MVANLVDFHFMNSSSSEGNITNLSINKVTVLISLMTSEDLTFCDTSQTLHLSMSSPI